MHIASRNSIIKALGQKIKALRLSHNWTVGQLAVITGLDNSTLEEIESGVSDPSCTDIFLLARALQIQLADLFDDVN